MFKILIVFLFRSVAFWATDLVTERLFLAKVPSLVHMRQVSVIIAVFIKHAFVLLSVVFRVIQDQQFLLLVLVFFQKSLVDRVVIELFI